MAIRIRLKEKGVRSPFSLATRYTYELWENGEVIKTGSGWGVDGAWYAGEKAVKRLMARREKEQCPRIG